MISIAMTTYNGEKYVGEQIDSILTQTISDFELIICDDCSKDNTVEIIKEKQKTDNRIKLHLNDNNLGFKKNFEKAISLCSGEYVALSDQDDIWERNHLELLYDNLGNYSLACGNAIMIDQYGQNKGVKLNEVEKLHFINNKNKLIYRILFYGNCFQGASMLFKKETINSYLPIPEKIPYHDVWFAACATLDKGIVYSFEIINRYRQHGSNITFLRHNEYKRSFLKKITSKFRTFFGGIKTDRFDYCYELKKRYGLENPYFLEAYKIIESIRNKKISIKIIKWFIKNYSDIVTEKTYRGLIKNIVIWCRWRKP